MFSCRADKREFFVFKWWDFPRGRKPCTSDIGIDSLLCSNADIYLLANCKRQASFSTERIRLGEERGVFCPAFWTDATLSHQTVQLSPTGLHWAAGSDPRCSPEWWVTQQRSVDNKRLWGLVGKQKPSPQLTLWIFLVPLFIFVVGEQALNAPHISNKSRAQTPK